VTARRLQHVSLQVPAGLMDACARFYETVLGMQRIPNLAGAVWFRFGDEDHVHLLEGPAVRTNGHLAVQVDDVQATVEAAGAAGGDPYEAPRIWGETRWFFRDPAGNLIEVFEVPPPDGDSIRRLAAERERG
jgi:catechol 2,3-dioxygenase-like lactoylglutathione lyase family enzyme